MFSLSIKNKLFGLGGIVILSFLAFAGVYIYSSTIRSNATAEEERVNTIERAESRAEVALQNARRFEKTYLLSGESTQDEANARLDAYSNAMKEFFAQIKVMEANITSDEGKAALEQLKVVAHKYQDAFDQTASTKAMVGYNESLGLLGRLRDSVHAVEHILNAEHNDALKVKMLMMRRHEKDFMMRLKQKYLDSMAKRNAEFAPLLATSRLPAAKKAQITQLMADYQRDFKAFSQGMLSVKQEISTIENEVVATKPAFDRVKELIRKLQAQNIDIQKSASTRVATMLVISILIGGAIILGTVIILAFAISRGLDEAVRVSRNVAQGKLGLNIRAKTNDEIGQLLDSMRVMDEKLIQVVDEVKNTVDRIGTASQEISNGNASLSQRTEQQASSLEETASSMEEMTGTVKQNADSASQAKQLAEANRQRASIGADVVMRTVDAMGEINESSTKISDIITTIDGIAFQTNLLALNAAVEAARAGEQGRGFAVVAAEVRSLAQRSADAAKEIKALIVDSVGKVKVGTQLVDESGKTLEEIIDGTQKVADIIAEITAASQEQASGIDQVNNAIAQMDNMTQDNAAMVEEAAAASRAMQEQAQNLDRLMSFFRIEDESRGAALLAGRGGRPMANARLADSGGDGKGSTPSQRPLSDHAAHEPQRQVKSSEKDSSEWEQF